MTTLQQADTASIKSPTQELNNPALLARATELETDIQDIEKALRIASVLQTSLDLHQVLEMFSQQAGRWIMFNGVRYEHTAQRLKVALGSDEKHTLTYRMVLGEQSLGEVTFSRKRKFSPKENQVLEYLLCGLVYPLRNALAYQAAVQASLRDPLTGMGNRAALDATMTREVELARRHETPLSVIAVDIDFFKRVNDTYGHATGDCVLRAVANALADTVRRSDAVFRYGGEEFTVLLSKTSLEGALLLAERIRKAVEGTEIFCNGAYIRVTVSLGVSSIGGNSGSGANAAALLERADAALYQAKGAGRNCVHQRTE
jgi:diguanylate cyclase (GGDEF)-like protein